MNIKLLKISAVSAAVSLSVIITPLAMAATPACGTTITTNTTLDSDMTCSGEAITIGADNITLDCAGHSINGTAVGNGISLSGKTGVSIKNCIVSNFLNGLHLVGTNESLVGYWRMDEASGSILTDELSRSNGQFLSQSNAPATARTAGILGNALPINLSASNRAVLGTGLVNYDRPWSVSTWAKWDGGQGVGGLMSIRFDQNGADLVNSGSYTLMASGGNVALEMSVQVGGTSGAPMRSNNTGVAITPGFHHYVITFGSPTDPADTALRAYFDGVFAGILYGRSNFASNGSNLISGSNRTLTMGLAGGPSPWIGSIDEVTLFRSALTQSEISALFSDVVPLSGSSGNSILNNSFKNTNNVLIFGLIGANTWSTPSQAGTNIIGGPFLGGNFYGSQAGNSGFSLSQACADANADQICDSSLIFNANNIDFLPLTINDDNDGIEAAVDTSPLVVSSDFSDGSTFGTITTNGGWAVSVTDLVAPAGVRVKIIGGSGTIAKVLTCNNNVETQLNAVGEIADITCGSTSVTAVVANPDIRIREPQTGIVGKATTVKLTSGQTVKMGSYVAASPLNTSALLVEVVDENDVVLGSGSLNPGQTLDIDPNGPNNTILLTNQSSDPVIFSLDGAEMNLAPREKFFDRCPNSQLDAEPFENRFSWTGGGSFMMKDPKTKALVASSYSLNQTKGCTCNQILEKTSGQEKGQLKGGCTKETLDTFIRQSNLLAFAYGLNGSLYYVISGIVASLAVFGWYAMKYFRKA